MNSYETMFYWIGIISSGFFTLLGMSIFGGWILDMIWRHFKSGKELFDVISAWKEKQQKKESNHS